MIRRAAAITAALLVLAAFLSGPATASAPAPMLDDSPTYQQQTANSTSTPTSSSGSDREVVADVDSRISILSYSYDRGNETMSIELQNRGESSADVTITEIVTPENAKGSKTSMTFGIQIVEVGAGETVTARVDVRDRGDAAGVTVTTSESVETGSGEALIVDLDSSTSILKGPATPGQVRAGALSGGLGTLVLVVLGAWQYVAIRNEDVQEAKLEPKLSVFGRFRE